MASIADEPRPRGDDPGPDSTLTDPSRSLWRGLISLTILVAMVVGLLLAVRGLHGVGDAVSAMSGGWLIFAVSLEVLSCIGYVIAFLQVSGPPSASARGSPCRSWRSAPRSHWVGPAASPSAPGCWPSAAPPRAGDCLSVV